MNLKQEAKKLSEIGEIIGQKFVVDFDKYKKSPEFQDSLEKLSKIKITKDKRNE